MDCPIPIRTYPIVTLAHGGGGILMRDLIEKMIAPLFANPHLAPLTDGVRLQIPGELAAFTTDSFVIHPRFFPGGDIGKLAICGTANDLAMCGAEPAYLSCGLILEEGLAMEELWQILQSLKATADEAGVTIVTGDTKVVDRGKGDGLYINTSGIGLFRHRIRPAPALIQPGDVILVNGDVGRHGIAVMAQREGLAVDTELHSDCGLLWPSVKVMLDAGIDIHAMRDCTRGGLASTVVELASSSGTHMALDATAVPIHEAVAGACELLGLDPLYVANEGRFITIVPAPQAEQAMDLLRAAEPALTPAIVGRVQAATRGHATLRSEIGAERILDLLSGEQLPRIC